MSGYEGVPALPAHFDPQHGGLVQFGSDEKLYVKFYRGLIPNAAKSKEAGRPVSDAADFIIIQQPGERDRNDRPATQFDIARFRRQWEAYQQGRGEEESGTPLAILFPNNPEVVDNLRHIKIMTVEVLAALNMTQIQSIGIGGQTFVDAAKAFLAAADKGKDFHALSERLDKLTLTMQEKDARIAALETALAEKERSEKKRTAA